MVRKSINEIAGCARPAAVGGAKISEKAHKVGNFQCSVSSVQPEKGAAVCKRAEDACAEEVSREEKEGNSKAVEILPGGQCRAPKPGGDLLAHGVSSEAGASDGSKIPQNGARDNAL